MGHLPILFAFLVIILLLGFGLAWLSKIVTLPAGAYIAIGAFLIIFLPMIVVRIIEALQEGRMRLGKGMPKGKIRDDVVGIFEDCVARHAQEGNEQAQQEAAMAFTEAIIIALAGYAENAGLNPRQKRFIVSGLREILDEYNFNKELSATILNTLALRFEL